MNEVKRLPELVGFNILIKFKNKGKVFIISTYNNTLLTLTDPQGNVLAWSSAGAIGFKGAKKATPFAASKVAESIVQAAQKHGIEKIYYETGTLKSETHFKYGLKNGLSRQYNDKGRLWLEETYKDDVRDGPTKRFDRQGRVYKVIRFKDGEKVSEQ